MNTPPRSPGASRSSLGPSAPTTSRRSMVVVLAAVAAVVAALFLVALLVGGQDGDEAADAPAPADGGGSTADPAVQGLEVGAVEVEGQALPRFPSGNGVADPATDPAVGQVAPELIGVSFDGSPVAVTADGTPKLVLFVAHWCPHCQREVPKVQELVDAGGVPADVQIVAVSTAVRPDDGNYPPSQWLEEEGWTSPVLLDDADASAARSWALPGFPYGVYVDGENRVVARTSGEVDTDEIEGLLRQLSQP